MRSLIRFRWRSLIIAILFVLVPWCLIAIPGESIGNDNGFEIYRIGGATSIFLPMNHGWPAVHMVSLKHSPNHPLIQSDDFGTKLDRYRSNSNLFVDSSHREFVAPAMATQFWSDINRWPGKLSNTGSPIVFEYWLNPIGLTINIAVLVFLLMLVILVCEYRIRRFGSLLRFSIFEFLVVFSLIAIGFGWIEMHNRRAQKEAIELTELNGLLVNKASEIRYDLLPTPVSRLFDYVAQPRFVHDDTFRPLKKVDTFAVLGKEITADKINDLAELPLSIRALSTDEVEAIASSSVHELELIGRPSEKIDFNELSHLDQLRRLNIRFSMNSEESGFDWAAIDSAAGRLEECKLTLDFHYGPSTDWPAKHILEAMKMQNVDEFMFLSINEPTLNELAKFPVKGKRVFLSFDSIPSNSELIKRLEDTGYIDHMIKSRTTSILGF